MVVRNKKLGIAFGKTASIMDVQLKPPDDGALLEGEASLGISLIGQ